MQSKGALMGDVVRHGGVLLVLFALAAAVSWFLPIRMSSLPVFLVAALIFLVYLGISLRWFGRAGKSEHE